MQTVEFPELVLRKALAKLGNMPAVDDRLRIAGRPAPVEVWRPTGVCLTEVFHHIPVNECREARMMDRETFGDPGQKMRRVSLVGHDASSHLRGGVAVSARANAVPISQLLDAGTHAERHLLPDALPDLLSRLEVVRRVNAWSGGAPLEQVPRASQPSCLDEGLEIAMTVVDRSAAGFEDRSHAVGDCGIE